LGLLFPIYGKIKNVPNHQTEYIGNINGAKLGKYPPFSYSGKPLWLIYGCGKKNVAWTPKI
jgi:hypothetical protein